MVLNLRAVLYQDEAEQALARAEKLAREVCATLSVYARATSLRNPYWREVCSPRAFS